MSAIVSKFMKDENGDAPLILLMIAIVCAFGVIGFDFSRAHAARGRVQTAADAASLAAAMQAEGKTQYEYVFLDVNGDETTDPSQAVEIKGKVRGHYFDLQDPVVQEKALKAAKAAFVKNFQGEMMPVQDAVGPDSLEAIPNRMAGYDFDAHVDWDSPSYTTDGETYYDKYVIPTAEAGVRSFLLVNLCRMFQGEDVFKSVVEAPKPDDWAGAIRLRVDSKAQAISVSP